MKHNPVEKGEEKGWCKLPHFQSYYHYICVTLYPAAIVICNQGIATKLTSYFRAGGNRLVHVTAALGWAAR